MQPVTRIPSPRSNTARPHRRSVLAAGMAALAMPFLPRYAHAAEVNWRLGHSAPVDFALHVGLLEAAGTIAARSEGRMTLTIYPNGELGSPVGLLAQIRAGTLDAAPLTNQVLANNLTAAALPMAGFAFSGYPDLWQAIDGGVGVFMRSILQERLGLVAMNRCWDFGFRQITTSGAAIQAAGNLEGLRLRTPPEAEFIALFQAFKALPMAMPLTALQSALRSRAIDGQESVLSLVKAANLFQVQSACALTNHVWDGQWMCISGKSWASLPAKLQQIVAAALDESGLRQRQETMNGDIKIRAELEAKGMKFNTLAPDSFRSVLRQAGYYAAWKKKIGDDGWAALEKHTGRLT